MHRIFNIFLLFLVLLQAGGVLLIYGYRQHRVKQEMRAQAKTAHENLEKIILSKEAYVKAKVDAHEVLVEGRMYDVHSMVVTEKGVEIMALNDEEESSIIKDMLGFFGFAHHKESPLPQKIRTLIGLEYTIPAGIGFSPVFSPVVSSFFQPAESFSSVNPAVFGPPPEMG